MDLSRRWIRICEAVLRVRARIDERSRSVRIANLDLTPHGVPSSRELRLRAERAELRLASLLRVGPVHSRPVWDEEVREAEATVNDLWRRWADTTFR